MRSALLGTTIGLAILIGLVTPASSADLVAPEQTEPGWTFAFAPYVWATGLEGDIGVGRLPEVDVDVSFSDVLKNFDIGFMGAGEARYERFGILTDLLYVKLSAHDGVNTRHIDADIDLTQKELTSLGALEYRVLEGEGGSLDVLAGGRLWWLKTELDFDGARLDRSASASETWVDPIVGLKGRINLSPEFYLTGWGMIGGFGVSSEFFWDAMGGLGYQVSDSFSLFAGYRGLGIDYKNDGFRFDVDMNGPLIGAVFEF
jgi:opacity protein-like surface antigen